MATDPKDVGGLQTALNDAAGKAAVLWTTFITFELYLAIAFGAVTHRNLFLEDPIRLPLLNVDLPLVGFFVVAPALLAIFHFYVLLQLLALGIKAKDYETLLKQAIPDPIDQQYLRQRLDPFLILQLFSGPASQRKGFSGTSLRIVSWLTLIGIPVLILLQAQVTFLPYHREWVVWLQRIVIFIDLVMIWYFWHQIHSYDSPTLTRRPRRAWQIFGSGAGICVALFSVGIVTFPGERVNVFIPDIPLFPTTWPPHWSIRDDWVSPHRLLFAGPLDEVTGRPLSLFSDRLVLTDQSFVDPEKIERLEISRSFRGRDLRQAVLVNDDLRKADFTGAMLDGAQLNATKLQAARFGFGTVGETVHYTSMRAASLVNVQAQGAALDFVDLRNALFDHAGLEGASLVGADLEGATLASADLRGASLDNADLMGASLGKADLRGATLLSTHLQGATLDSAQLQGATLDGAELQGAFLFNAELEGASLAAANLQGAYLYGAELQGANLENAQLQHASLVGAQVWRASGTPVFDLTDIDEIDLKTTPWGANDAKRSSFSAWRDSILMEMPTAALSDAKLRLSALDPGRRAPKNAINWKSALATAPQTEERRRRLAAFLTDLACSSDRARNIARIMLYEGGISNSEQFKLVLKTLQKAKSDRALCPAVRDFTDQDWSELDADLRDMADPTSDMNAKSQQKRASERHNFLRLGIGTLTPPYSVPIKYPADRFDQFVFGDAELSGTAFAPFLV
jgi:uncharacterized protein YjbI with pentapeptide repeats